VTQTQPSRAPERRALTGESLVAGVVGAPIRQSLSPLLHNGWLAALGIDGVYVPFGLHPDRFEAFIEGMRGGGVCGVNVTLPFKARALAVCDAADAAATAAGAANLLLFRPDGAIEGRNTDGVGLISAFQEQAPEVRFHDAVVAVLGAGGAAQGALAALLSAGARRIFILNRTEPRARALADLFGACVQALPLDQASAAFETSHILINASAAGLQGDDAPALPLDRLAPGSVVMDMVYKPLQTPLLRDAARLGLATVDGLAMLIGQAKPSFEAFFGRPAPIDGAARASALAHLAHEAAS
jgi:shikimate dehydrogenase